MDKFKWTDETVIDFVNCYIKLHKLPVKFELENLEILESFKRGDKVSDWHTTIIDKIKNGEL
jgi:hypothetical protein